MSLKSFPVDGEAEEVHVKVEVEEERVPGGRLDLDRNCLICLNYHSCSESHLQQNFQQMITLFRIEDNHDHHHPHDSIGKHLFSVFLLRNLLQVPRKEVVSLLATLGTHPGEWGSVCGDCSNLVRDAFRIYQQIQILEKELQGRREELKGKLEQSLGVGDDEEQEQSYRNNEKKTTGSSWRKSHELIRNYFKKSAAQPFRKLENKPTRERGRPKKGSRSQRTRVNQEVEEEDGASEKCWSPEPHHFQYHEHDLLDSPSASPPHITNECFADDNVELMLEDAPKPNRNNIITGFVEVANLVFKSQKRATSSRRVKRQMAADTKKTKFKNTINKSKTPLAVVTSSRYLNTSRTRISPNVKDKSKKYLSFKTGRKCDDEDDDDDSVPELTSSTPPAPASSSQGSELPSSNNSVETGDHSTLTFHCKKCNHTYNTESYFEKHLRHHKKYRKTTCKLCHFPSKSQQALRTHMRRKHFDESMKPSSYLCSECDFSSTTSRALYIHKQSHLSTEERYKKARKRLYQCEKCPYSTRLYQSFYGHKSSHLEGLGPSMTRVEPNREKSYSCEECGDSTTSNSYFGHYSHVKNAHGLEKQFLIPNPKPGSAYPNVFSCGLCHHSFTFQNKFEKHLKIHDKKNYRSYFCTICNFPCTSKFGLQRHMEKEHPEQVKTFFPSDDGLVGGGVDGSERSESVAVSPSSKQAIRRNNQTTRENSYFCEICEHGFVRKQTLWKHRSLHKKHKSTTCGICKFPCQSPEQLARHVKTYHTVKVVKSKRIADKPFQCEKCDYSSRVYSQYFIHKHRHVITDQFDETDEALKAEDKVSCKLCGEVGSRRLMFKHMKVVHGIGGGAAVCHICSKSYSSTKTLKNHVRKQHENDCLYNCEKCGRGFMTKNRFEAHQVKCVHGLKGSLVCEACGNVYACRDTLRMHLKKFHPEVYESRKVTTDQLASYVGDNNKN